MPKPLVQLTDRVVDLQRSCVVCGADEVRLSTVELRLFHLLASRAGQVVSRDTLWSDVWSGEQSPSSRAIDASVRRLRAKLERDPGRPVHIVSVYGEGYRFDPPAAPPAPAPPGRGQRGVAPGPSNLPPAPPMLGRDAALADVVAAHAAGARLITLVGPAGVGKTRLALAAAQALAATSPGGAWFCDLAAAHTRADVLSRVAASVSIGLPAGDLGDETARLSADLGRRPALVLLVDNAESVAGPLAAIARAILDAAPDATLLVTSRVALGLVREAVHRVRPLASADALTLFNARARLAAPPDQAPSDPTIVAAIVARLDCLPLAIELAAARVALLPPAQLLARLEARFDLLTDPLATRGPRHASLGAAIDVSWELLTDVDRAALCQCAVFSGRFTVEAAEAVVALPDGRSVLDALHRLIAQSLLIAQGGPGPPSLRLLESVRDYARARRDDGDGARQRRATYFSALARASVERIRETSDVTDLALLGLHADTLQELADDSREGAATAAWASMALAAWHDAQGPPEAAIDYSRRAVESAERTGDAALVAEAVLARSVTHYLYLPRGAAIGDAETAVARARATGDTSLVARALLQLGVATPLVDGHAPITEALALYTARGHRPGIGRAESLLAWLFDQRDDVQRAAEFSARAVASFEPLGPMRGYGIALINHGAILLDLARFEEAREPLAAGVRINHALGYRVGEAHAVGLQGLVEMALGHYDAARERLHTARGLKRAVGRDRDIAVATLYCGMCEVISGHVEAALADLAEAERLAAAQGERALLVTIASFRALALADGDPDGALAALVQARAHLEAGPTERQQALTAIVAARLGVDRGDAGFDAALVTPDDDAWELRLARRVARGAA